MDQNGELKSGLVTLPKILMDLLDDEAGEGPVKMSRSKLLELLLTERYAVKLREKGYRLEPALSGTLMTIVLAETVAAP